MPSAKKEVKKKVVSKKKVAKKRVSKKGPEMVSYSMRMVIPTGDYANIQPEIIVKAGTMDEAHAYIAPHMNKLWKEYFNISKRRVEPVKKPVPTKTENTATATEIVEQNPTEPIATQTQEEPSPVSSVALTKATQAIQSCLSLEALELIIQQVKVSVKLTEENKISLAGIIMEKENELKIKILTSEEDVAK